ncbi:SusC/RagA family TonB-linked outer membrane protein [Niabella drilacis]|nr:SusC/RagA family TonB-linked outer membrane protein [Niabella drilacis]
MKLSLAFLLLGLQLSATNYGQNTISLKEEHVSLTEIFKKIEKRSPYRFYFSSDVVPKRYFTSVYAKDATISEVLNKVLQDAALAWKQLPNNRIIVIARESGADSTAVAKRTITGVVKDPAGLPLANVSVTIKGTANGVTTSETGRFSVSANPGDVLVFSIVGYETKEITIADQDSFDIILAPVENKLEEVVVVGYGVQKRVNLTGAVATVSADKLESRATMNLSSSLSGLASGVSVNQGSGKPGSDGASIRIRGVGTFNSSYLSPLVIVDGSEASINSVNSEDVESISFLKDAASAAIYGSRGANGVLLITTKKGKKGQAPRITYTGLLSNTKMSGKAFRFEDNYAEYMEMANRWYTNAKWDATTKYTKEAIDEWRAAEGKDPNSTDNPYGVPNYLAYPSTQWSDYLFLPSTSQKHTVSVSGGSENTTYLLSFGHLNNPGTLQNTGLKNYQGRVNLETRINKFLKVGTQTYATFERTQPGNTDFTYMFQNTPAMTPYYDGMYGIAVDNSSSNNLLATVVSRGGSYDDTRLNTTWYAGVDITKGLSAQVRYNYQTLFSETATYSKKVDKKNFRTGEIKPGVGSSDATTTRGTTRYANNTATATLNYMRSFGDHSITGLLGAERYYWNVKGFSATRTGLLDLSLPDFTAALDKLPPTLGGTAEQDYAVVSYFGRLNYAYKQRYLFEANVRRDGSSRFGPDYRWGMFPSFSAGWRISEEKFMEGTKDVLSNLKLRGSWGQLGNTTSGYYEWQATYGSVNYSFDGNVYDGLRKGKIANSLLHWESATSADIGIEAAFLNNRLTLEADYYSRLTKGILAAPSVYLTMGTIGAPTTNTSDMRNSGFEFSLGWRDRVKEFQYSVNANFSVNKNIITQYKGKFTEGWVTDETGNRTWVTNRGDVADVSGNTIRVEGHPYNEYYIWQRHQGNGNIYLADGVTPDPNGGPLDGMIRTKADLDWVKAMLAQKDANGKPRYNFNNQSVGQNGGLWYGEAIYADLNGDGMYGTNDNDRFFTGKSSMPKFSFGLNLSAAWKGIDLNMTWAGNLGMYYYIYERGFNSMSSSSWQEGTIVALNARNIYYYSDPQKAATDPNYDPATDPNANINAPYLRIGNIASAYRSNTNDLYNASYVKLKTLQIGYTFPKPWTTKAYANRVRLFASAENVFTITNFPGVDPEIGGGGFQSYPIPRIISGGLNITF